jgi:hypothetical protein
MLLASASHAEEMVSANRRTYFPVSLTNSLYTCTQREKKYLERGKEGGHYGVLADEGTLF